MRLALIKEVLKAALPNLAVSAANNAAGMTRLSGVTVAMRAVTAIKATGVLQEEVEDVLSVSDVADAVQTDFTVETSLANRFDQALGKLRTRTEHLSLALRDVIPPEHVESIVVRLPDNLDLPGFADGLEKLNTALNQILIPHTKADLKIGHFDYGSNWVEIVFASLAAMHVISHIVRLIDHADVGDDQAKAREELLRSLRNRVNAEEAILKRINEIFEEDLRSQQDAELHSIALEAGVPEADRHEYVGRLAHSITLLRELLSQGFEIHPSLTAPEQIRDRFPTARELLPHLKLLTGKTSSEGDTE